MQLRTKGLAACLAVAAIAAMALPEAHADWFYRQVTPTSGKPVPPNPDTPPAPVPKTTKRWWRLAGNADLGKTIKLTELGLNPNNAIIVNGTLLGGSPYGYWSSGQGSSVLDMCDYIKGLPDGPWECGLETSFTGAINLVIVKYGDFDNPILFRYGAHASGLPANPPELFGTAVPQPVIQNFY